MEELLEIVLEILALLTDNNIAKKREGHLIDLEKAVGTTITHDKKEAFLLFAVLMYLFYENDGILTPKEKKLIKNEMKKRKDKFSKKEYYTYSSILYKKHDKAYIEEIIIKQNYYQMTVYNVIKDAREILEGDEGYRNAIRTLELTVNKLV